MPINKPTQDTYKIWPFKADLEDGRTNIGAIDLTKEPERIDEIHELQFTPRLKTAIYHLNKENTAFMTLGCLIEKDPEKENCWWAYIEFCFRPNINVSSVDVDTLDEQFLNYLATKYSSEFSEALRHHLIWEAFHASIYDNTPSRVYSVFLNAQAPENYDQAYTLLIEWLHSEFLHLAQ
ncbi:hypothetical protein [Acinetobacter baumannii]|uniref:Uncharacterized protein n=1 Tax=Acinetobacter baumannii TaxID=470 RepID=A0A6H2UTX2_ACIBA|nr:hypothetical protein [Acinetobacter baumannii]EXB44254.1 hypothetical protein J540_3344 [Acinetobacter baumannii 1440422]AIL80571.1 hypothetical protein IX87_18760 [Acinetobacter baumannii]AIS07617.1 hypothetical protein LX00_14830 [Acinetobacter baumannii]ATD20987.1 hypothetical protein BS098_14230 [Acinetobacter baumannii]AVO91255.1 hypothetical protein AM480_10560 [Acinetobacter baumannii]